MYRKKGRGWTKHIDFMLLDVLCMQIAFIVSYIWRFGPGNPYTDKDYRILAAAFLLIDFFVEIVSDIKYVDDIEMFYNIWNPYQIKYDCNIDRRFDNSKINRATNNKLQYTLVAEGINKCLKKFIESPEWRNINWKLNFWMDNITGEKTKIWDADGLKEKARYVKYCIKK